MATFFQAWRRRQADRQAAEWDDERATARRAVEDVPAARRAERTGHAAGWGGGRAPPRRAVEDVPAAIREDVRRAIETLIDGPDDRVEPALKDLWRVLEPYPELDARFNQLRIVDDAVEFLKS